ncbi:MAG: hypothetical protein B9S32_06880 [Verrucomicrobia bacterium Tous-C9LFEB]|nr:MAG: hypothetical protein B9S32_06880 [Verrucomicrobia bacterium Tous-C9LFEB]
MKINREARQTAKKLFKFSVVNGQLDESRVRETVDALCTQKPRNYLAIATRLLKLVEIEVEQNTVSVTSAVALPDQGASAFAALERKFGPALQKNYTINPSLIGGLRVQRGSDVWDDSIRGRLNTLRQNLQ